MIATYANRETRLFINDGDGGFVVQPTPAFENANEVSKFFIWIDLDNDGQEELIGSHSFPLEMPKAVGLYRVTTTGKSNVKESLAVFTS